VTYRIAGVWCVLLLACSGAQSADKDPAVLPRVEPVEVLARRDIDFLTETAPWQPTIPDLLSNWRCGQDAKRGKYALRIHTRVNHFDKVDWPVGLNGLAFETAGKPMDWSGCNALAFDMKLAVKGSDRKFHPLEIHLWRKKQKCGVFLMVEPSSEWRRIQAPFGYFLAGRTGRMEDGGQVGKIRLGITEYGANDGAELDLRLDNFHLLMTRPAPWTERCERGTALGALYIGPADEMNILPEGTKRVAAAACVVTGPGCWVTRESAFRFVFHELFTGKEHAVSMEAPGTAIPRSKTITPLLLDTSALAPGYYLATFDVLAGGKSILKGRVGVDDFYIRKKGERIEHSLMSCLTADTFFAQHRKYGYIFKRVRPSLPHTWSPLNAETYPQFLLNYVRRSEYYMEDMHSSFVTLAYAAETFAQAGEVERKAFTEKMLRRLADWAVTGMVAKGGAIIRGGCAIADREANILPYGACGMKPQRRATHSASQTYYWMVCVARTALYFAGVGEDPAYARSLVKSMDQPAACVLKAFSDEIDGRRVLGNQMARIDPREPLWRHVPKGPSGKPTQMCCGTRSLAALAYYAYARQALLGSVAPDILETLRDTAHWYSERIERNNGWAAINSGSLFYEPNMYLGEGYVGYFLYNRLVGDGEEAERARKWAKIAYRFITDRSTTQGGERAKPCLSNWGGSWFTWSFSEYFRLLEHDKELARWIDTAEEDWRSRGFRDILHRPWYNSRRDLFTETPSGAGLYRSPDKGAIYLSWLGAMAVYEQRAMGKSSRLLDITTAKGK